MKKLFILFVLTIALLLSTKSALADYPKPTGYVNDFANVLSPNFKQTEEQKLSDYTKKTTNEIAVVMIDTTGDMTIENYAQGLADQWKPGVSGKDNGVIILFAMQDHHDRIQIGCGFEGSFTDIQASDILAGDTRSLMRAGKIDDAVNTTVDQVISTIGNATSQPCKGGSQQAIDSARASTSNTTSDQNSTANNIFLTMIVIAIVIIIIGVIIYNVSNNGSCDDDDDSGTGGGFLGGAITGGILGSSFGGGSSSSDDSSESSSSGGDSFGGFSGGSFSGGGGSGGW